MGLNKFVLHTITSFSTNFGDHAPGSQISLCKSVTPGIYLPSILGVATDFPVVDTAAISKKELTTDAVVGATLTFRMEAWRMRRRS
jgi:hypothetical protein